MHDIKTDIGQNFHVFIITIYTGKQNYWLHTYMYITYKELS